MRGFCNPGIARSIFPGEIDFIQASVIERFWEPKVRKGIEMRTEYVNRRL